MEFNQFLSSYLPDPDYGGDRLYADMIEQAKAAEALGFRGVTIPEHHLINVLATPAPLMMAVKVAAETERLEIVTSVSVLPLHDMRIFAGEVVMADILCEGRLMLGVGRGAFAYEMARLGAPIEESRARFDESLDVLIALLGREEVSWDGAFYRFEPLTVMPRPVREIPLMIAVMAPRGIAACVKRGFHIQTTPLAGDRQLLIDQVEAFTSARREMGAAGEGRKLMLSRVAFAARDDADARAKLELAHDYYSRFDNVFTGPGLVERGRIKPLPRGQTIGDLSRNVLVCTPAEMVDRLGPYLELGIDELIVNLNIGAPQEEVIESMHRMAEEVMPRFTRAGRAAEAAE